MPPPRRAGTPSSWPARRPPSSTAPAGRSILREVFGHAPISCTPTRDGRIDRRAAAGARQEPAVRQLADQPAVRRLRRRGARATEAAPPRWKPRPQRLAQQLGVAAPRTAQRRARHPDWPTQDLYVTFRKAILPDEEANMLAIPRKQRAMVRKGIKNGLQSELDAGVDRFFALYADNVHRHGTPALPRRYFAALLREFGTDCEVLTVSAADGRPLQQRPELLLPRRSAAVLRRRRRGRARPGRQRLQVLGADAPRLRARAQGVRLRSQQAGHRARMRSRRTGVSSRRRCTTNTVSTSATPFRRTTPPTPSTS